MARIRDLRQFVQAQEAKLAAKYHGTEPVEQQNPEALSESIELDKTFRPLPGRRFLGDSLTETTFIVTPNS